MIAGGVAVALATRNGERHLPEQLASLSSQSLPPDLVAIHDDGSEDGTLDAIHAFAHNAPFDVIVVPRTPPHGTDRYSRIASSFVAALTQCRNHEFIALCDQDDRWAPDRLEATVDALSQRPTALLAFGDARYVDEQSVPLGGRLRDTFPVPDGLADMPAADQLRIALRRPFVTGAASTMRASLLDLGLPIPNYWLHDRWLSLMAAASGGLVPVNQPLMDYRLHPEQAVGLADADGPWVVRLLRDLALNPSPKAAFFRLGHLRRRLRDPAVGLRARRSSNDLVPILRLILKG